MKNFKEKGYAQERKLAREFGEWWCGDPKALWRNTVSGARATVQGDVFGGDLIPIINEAMPWPLSVEIKKAEGWSIESFIKGNPSEPLLLYMIQTVKSAHLGCNERAMLVCAKNYMKPVVFLHHHGFEGLKGVKHAVARLKNLDVEFEECRWTYPVIDFHVMHLEAFFQHFQRKDFE
jgi:hypothetical protein